ncbi:hypothetical protein DFQ27_001070 [Actinomortierella ambigua]|uniref:Uncharacterized protein n=1 Tax=Actinomortierella ambigua TaxID=1343610 RepID=A0A9P6QG04_9FUNG|nr:hypothetical protein DFQ27_001070 [Actinomortierella ambigua]
MSSTVSVASSAASSTVASDAAVSSSQEDLDGDPTVDAPKQPLRPRASYDHHEAHEEAPSAYDADEDFSGSEYSTSSCESCSRHYSPSRGSSAEFSDRSEHYEAPYLKQPPSSHQPRQKQPSQPTTSSPPPSPPRPPPAQYPWQAQKTSRPSSPSSSSSSSSKPQNRATAGSNNNSSSSNSKSKSKSTNGKSTNGASVGGSLPSPSQVSKTVLEFVLVGALMFTIVSAAFTFSYVVTATNHAGQKLREAIEARERSVQRALERVAGEDYVKVRRQQQRRQHHHHQYHGTATQKQTGSGGVIDDDRLSPAEWQELIHAAVYGLVSKWSGQGVAR